MYFADVLTRLIFGVICVDVGVVVNVASGGIGVMVKVGETFALPVAVSKTSRVGSPAEITSFSMAAGTQDTKTKTERINIDINLFKMNTYKKIV
ncbi:MAG: hypothetical protein C0401_07280 [Anaerolinea sp.]|nr:hypothetical protein [Anaerolinea sp.]